MGDHNIPLKTLCTTSNFLSISFRFWDYYPPKMGVVPQICLKLQIPYYHPPRTNKPCDTLHAPMLHAMHTSVTCYADSNYTLFALSLCVMHILMHCTPLLWTTCILLHATHTCCMLFTLLLHTKHPHYILCAPSCTTPTMHYMYPVTCYAHPYYTLYAPSLCAMCTLIMTYTHPLQTVCTLLHTIYTPLLWATYTLVMH